MDVTIFVAVALAIAEGTIHDGACVASLALDMVIRRSRPVGSGGVANRYLGLRSAPSDKDWVHFVCVVTNDCRCWGCLVSIALI